MSVSFGGNLTDAVLIFDSCVQVAKGLPQTQASLDLRERLQDKTRADNSRVDRILLNSLPYFQEGVRRFFNAVFRHLLDFPDVFWEIYALYAERPEAYQTLLDAAKRQCRGEAAEVPEADATFYAWMAEDYKPERVRAFYGALIHAKMHLKGGPHLPEADELSAIQALPEDEGFCAKYKDDVRLLPRALSAYALYLAENSQPEAEPVQEEQAPVAEEKPMVAALPSEDGFSAWLDAQGMDVASRDNFLDVLRQMEAFARRHHMQNVRLRGVTDEKQAQMRFNMLVANRAFAKECPEAARALRSVSGFYVNYLRELSPAEAAPVEEAAEPHLPVEETAEPETPVEEAAEPEAPVEEAAEPELPVEETAEPKMPAEEAAEPEPPEEDLEELEIPEIPAGVTHESFAVWLAWREKDADRRARLLATIDRAENLARKRKIHNAHFYRIQSSWWPQLAASVMAEHAGVRQDWLTVAQDLREALPVFLEFTREQLDPEGKALREAAFRKMQADVAANKAEAKEKAADPNTITMAGDKEILDQVIASDQEPQEQHVDFSALGNYDDTVPLYYVYRQALREDVSGWVELYVALMREVVRGYKGKVLYYFFFETEETQKKHLFATDKRKDLLKAPVKIKDNIFIETGRTPTEIVGAIRDTLTFCEIDFGAVDIVYRATENKAALVEPEKEQEPQPDEGRLVQAIREEGLFYTDNRSNGGMLRVYGGLELTAFLKKLSNRYGIKFHFSTKGTPANPSTHCWWTTGKPEEAEASAPDFEALLREAAGKADDQPEPAAADSEAEKKPEAPAPGQYVLVMGTRRYAGNTPALALQSLCTEFGKYYDEIMRRLVGAVCPGTGKVAMSRDAVPGGSLAIPGLPGYLRADLSDKDVLETARWLAGRCGIFTQIRLEGAPQPRERFSVTAGDLRAEADTPAEALRQLCDELSRQHTAQLYKLRNAACPGLDKVILHRYNPDMDRLWVKNLNVYIERDLSAEDVQAAAKWFAETCGLGEAVKEPAVTPRVPEKPESFALEVAGRRYESAMPAKALQRFCAEAGKMYPERMNALRHETCDALGKVILHRFDPHLNRLRVNVLGAYIDPALTADEVLTAANWIAKKCGMGEEAPKKPAPLARLVFSLGKNRYEGSTPAKALREFCHERCKRHPISMIELKGMICPQLGKVILNREMLDNRSLYVNRVGAYIDADLTAEEALEAARWIAVKCGGSRISIQEGEPGEQKTAPDAGAKEQTKAPDKLVLSMGGYTYEGDAPVEALRAFCNDMYRWFPRKMTVLTDAVCPQLGRAVIYRGGLGEYGVSLNRLTGYIDARLTAREALTAARWLAAACGVRDNVLANLPEEEIPPVKKETPPAPPVPDSGEKARLQGKYVLTMGSHRYEAGAPVEALRVFCNDMYRWFPQEMTSLRDALCPKLGRPVIWKNRPTDSGVRLSHLPGYIDDRLTAQEVLTAASWLADRCGMRESVQADFPEEETPPAPPVVKDPDKLSLSLWGYTYEGDAPAKVLRAFCNNLYRFFPRKMTALVDATCPKLGRAVICKGDLGDDGLRLTGLDGYVDARLTAREALTAARWLAAACGIRDTVQSNLPEEETPIAPPDDEKAPPAPPVTPAPLPVRTDDLGERLNAVLKESFPDGLRLISMRLRQFRRQFEEKYGAPLEMPDERLISLLRAAGSFREERVFARADEAQKDLLEEILAEVERTLAAGASCVYIAPLFERFRQPLAEQLSIYSADALQDLLARSRQSQYNMRNGCLQKWASVADASDDVVRALRESPEPLNYQQLQEKLWYLPLARIKQALNFTPELVNVDRETYMYAPNLPVSPEELEKLKAAMRRKIEDEGFLVAQDLRQLLEANCPAAAIDTAGMKDFGLRNALCAILREDFTLNGAIINVQGETMNLSRAYRHFCQEHDRLTLEELKDFSNRLDQVIYWWDVLQEMVRISPTELVNRRLVRFDAEAVDAVLDGMVTGDYLPIQEISLYLHFPALDFPWNRYVLESYLIKGSARFHIAQAAITQTGVYGAVVRNAAKLEGYRDVVLDALARDESWKDEATLLELLVARGYQARRSFSDLPALLRDAEQLREKYRNEEN